MLHRCTTFAVLAVFCVLPAEAQHKDKQSFTRHDRLRGSITPERAWWDVQHYHLSLEVFPKEKRIRGSNAIRFRVIKAHDRMQVDLQKPLQITRIVWREKELKFEREGNVFWVEFPTKPEVGSEQTITVFYEGTPTESRNPPWSGGLTWKKDGQGNPFIATSCQGIGASIWWPNKDHCYEEPDRGMDISITVPQTLTAVANGRLRKTEHHPDAKTKTFHWRVVNPINNYAVNMNIGNYVRFQDIHEGEKGELDLDYWVLEHQKQKAEKHFREAPRTIEAFEHWFGPYPFYEDSYKLVVVPYLGMEHQSSVTYGNGFRNGYRGRDLSATGVGLKFDFIIVHESGHEWFGNNITAKDIADMWIHESFTNYSENLFVNYHFTRKEAEDYVIGCRRLVRNDRPIIGTYNVNKSGSGDMYYKGGNMLHMIRNIVDDDKKWRSILRGLNKTFRHQTVTSAQIEQYVSREAGIDLSCVFDQYLRTAKIPTFNYALDRTSAVTKNGTGSGSEMTYYVSDAVPNFKVRIRILIDGKPRWITPTPEKQTLKLDTFPKSVTMDRNFYLSLKKH